MRHLPRVENDAEVSGTGNNGLVVDSVFIVVTIITTTVDGRVGRLKRQRLQADFSHKVTRHPRHRHQTLRPTMPNNILNYLHNHTCQTDLWQFSRHNQTTEGSDV
jgi:hypothetical protein